MRPVVPWCSPLHSPGGKDALCWEVISKYAKYSPFLAAKKPLPRMWVLKQISFATDLWPEVYRCYELSNACYCWYTHEGGMWGNICNNGPINLLKKYIWYTYWHSCTVLVHDWLYGTVKQLVHLLYFLVIKWTLKEDLKRNDCSNWQVWEGVWVGGRWQLPLVLRTSSRH